VVVGLNVVGLRVVGLNVVGLRVVGLNVVGLRVVGFWFVCLGVVGLNVVGLRVVGLFLAKKLSFAYPSLIEIHANSSNTKVSPTTVSNATFMFSI
jgi:hypothetical protein